LAEGPDRHHWQTTHVARWRWIFAEQ